MPEARPGKSIFRVSYRPPNTRATVARAKSAIRNPQSAIRNLAAVQPVRYLLRVIAVVAHHHHGLLLDTDRPELAAADPVPGFRREAAQIGDEGLPPGAELPLLLTNI